MSAAIARAAYTCDATKAVGLHTSKRRMDEDLKHAVTDDMVKEGKAKNARCALRSVDGVTAAHGGMVSKWEVIKKLEYQASVKRLLSKSDTINVSIDGKRMGQPGEETEAMLGNAFPEKVSFVMLPMVSEAARWP